MVGRGRVRGVVPSIGSWKELDLLALGGATSSKPTRADAHNAVVHARRGACGDVSATIGGTASNRVVGKVTEPTVVVDRWSRGRGVNSAGSTVAGREEEVDGGVGSDPIFAGEDGGHGHGRGNG